MLLLSAKFMNCELYIEFGFQIKHSGFLMLWVVPCADQTTHWERLETMDETHQKSIWRHWGVNTTARCWWGQVPRKERGLGRRPTFSDPFPSSSVRQVSWAEVLAGQGAATLSFCSCHGAGRLKLDFRTCWGTGALISTPEFQGESKSLLYSRKRELESHQLCTKIETSFVPAEVQTHQVMCPFWMPARGQN